jgi:hypothetical protein
MMLMTKIRRAELTISPSLPALAIAQKGSYEVSGLDDRFRRAPIVSRHWSA